MSLMNRLEDGRGDLKVADVRQEGNVASLSDAMLLVVVVGRKK